MSLEWIFDPLPPSGAMTGGNVTSHVFHPSLDILVRESLQNIRDQHLGGPVKARFSLIHIEGTQKNAFLKSIGWTQLQPHVAGAAAAKSAQISHWLSRGLESMQSDQPLVLLRIEDMNTKGLTGGEDNPTSNFNGLCRNTLISQDKGDRGGSFGLGKGIFWLFSGVGTVLFSSRIENDPQPGVRFFGRTELPGHQVDGTGYAGAGWFGKRDSNRERAISAWDNEVGDLVADCLLDRPSTMGTGTSILVVGFREPKAETPRPVADVAQEILDLTSTWFWPALEAGLLEVSADAYDGDSKVFADSVGLTDVVIPFVDAVTATVMTPLPLSPGDVHEVEIPMNVPGKHATSDDPAQPAVSGKVRLVVRCSEKESSLGRLTNTVALVRGPRMVVEYRPVKRVPGDKRFHAVLLAGLANGDSVADEAIESFLRASEPPAHDEWDPDSRRLSGEYQRGYKVAINKLFGAIETAVASLFAEQLANDSRGPERLAKMFKIDNAPGKGPRPVKPEGPRFSEKVKASFDGTSWRFEGRVARRKGNERQWSVKVALRLAGEAGEGEPLPIANLKAPGCKVIKTAEEATINVPAEMSSINFDGTSIPLTSLADADLADRTCVNVVVNSATGGTV